ncbi:hypothetical protein HMPREF3156_00354 [Neisseria sp. HMSC06F02]|nr:hypothetical protein HMPREF3156_00354 [Neisseria sp. HMSC06F02]
MFITWQRIWQTNSYLGLGDIYEIKSITGCCRRIIPWCLCRTRHGL